MHDCTCLGMAVHGEYEHQHTQHLLLFLWAERRSCSVRTLCRHTAPLQPCQFHRTANRKGQRPHLPQRHRCPLSRPLPHSPPRTAAAQGHRTTGGCTQRGRPLLSCCTDPAIRGPGSENAALAPAGRQGGGPLTGGSSSTCRGGGGGEMKAAAASRQELAEAGRRKARLRSAGTTREGTAGVGRGLGRAAAAGGVAHACTVVEHVCLTDVHRARACVGPVHSSRSSESPSCSPSPPLHPPRRSPQVRGGAGRGRGTGGPEVHTRPAHLAGRVWQ